MSEKNRKMVYDKLKERGRIIPENLELEFGTVAKALDPTPAKAKKVKKWLKK